MRLLRSLVGLLVLLLASPASAQITIQPANLGGFYPSTGGATGTVLIGNGVGSAATFSASPTITKLTVGNGTSAAPALTDSTGTSGFYVVGAGSWGYSSAGTGMYGFNANAIYPITDVGPSLGLFNQRWSVVYGQTIAQERNALTTTSTDGITLENTTAATGGATVQISPRLRFRGNAWNSSGSASESDSWIVENIPRTVAGTTTADLFFKASIAGGAYLPIAMFRTNTGATPAFAVFGPFTDTGNYESLQLQFDNNLARINVTAVGTGTQRPLRFDMSGTNIWTMGTTGGLQGVAAGSQISQYKGVTTAGHGVPATYGYGDTAAATGVTASIATYTVGAADGTFEVGCNVLVTTSTTHSFSCDVTYTDEGNTGRTLILPVAQLAGAFITGGLITNVTGAGPYETATLTIRAKAATAITVRTSAGGTYTTVTYNARGHIKQIG